MFKRIIDGKAYYCLTEEEKEQIFNVLEKVEDIGDNLWPPNKKLFLKNPPKVF